mmetsp:Transcript_1192/g.2878  ORF Transcript_1192/g.2878 Transcript_1192/m.2878 type:complete len:282 (+) Transcript_1192:17-862(+)
MTLNHISSTTTAVAPPPPLQMAATPRRPPRRLSTPSSVTRMRAPDAPIGWPSATPPPSAFTCTASAGKPSSCLFARSTAENASLISQASISSTPRFARSSASFTALAGAMGKSPGCSSASAHARTRAMRREGSTGASSPPSKRAAAPSAITLAFPAVTVPSLANAGLSLASFARSTASGGSSCVTSITSADAACPFLSTFAGTPTISPSKSPRATAARARSNERVACASCSSLLIPLCRAVASAIAPMCLSPSGSQSPSRIMASSATLCPILHPLRADDRR